MIYLALNRGNLRAELFHKPEGCFAFIRVLAEGLQKYPVEISAFTLMPNQWHLVLRPAEDGQMGRLLRWVTATHSLRIHAHDHTRGQGPLYQSRFKSFPVQDDSHFTPFAVTLSAIRCGRDWSIIQKTGNMAPYKSSRLGRCHVCRTGSLVSMIRFRKRNWRRCGVVPFVGVLLDRPIAINNSRPLWFAKAHGDGIADSTGTRLKVVNPGTVRLNVCINPGKSSR